MATRTTRATPLVPGALADHVLCVLGKVGQAALRLSEETLQDTGLRIRHYSVLQALEEHGAQAQQELSTYLRIDTATMVSTVDDLERLGYATRQRDPNDRRRSLVAVTAAGRAALRHGSRLLDDLESRALAGLSATQRRQLASVLAALSNDGPFLDLHLRPKG